MQRSRSTAVVRELKGDAEVALADQRDGLLPCTFSFASLIFLTISFAFSDSIPCTIFTCCRTVPPEACSIF